ncbi:hypothetical protein [Streptococcus dentiloxodontae]
MNSKQKKLAITAVILLVLLVGILVAAKIYRNAHKDGWSSSAKTSISNATTSSVSSESSTSTSKSSSDPSQEAEDTLETDDKIKDNNKISAAQDSIKTVFDYINKTDANDLTPSVNTCSNLTSKSMLQSLKTMMKAGYTIDLNSLQLYESANENVEQFIISMTKASDNTQIALAGNYVPNTKQVEIASIHGTPTDVLGD